MGDDRRAEPAPGPRVVLSRYRGRSGRLRRSGQQPEQPAASAGVSAGGSAGRAAPAASDGVSAGSGRSVRESLQAAGRRLGSFARSWSRLRRRRRIPWQVATALVLTVVAGVGYLLLGTEVFRAERVRVTGVDRLSAADVAGAARVPTTEPLARLATGPIARRVAALAPVAAVDVRRQWPHTVRIAVTERVPLVAVPRAGGGVALLDRAGVAFAAAAAPPAGVPLVRLAPAGRTEPALQAALRVVTALPPALRDRLRSVDAASGDGVSLLLRDGRQVVWGSADRSGDKAEILLALLRRKGATYDVSAPSVVTVRR